MFLVTNKENKTFGDFVWGDDVINETENPNHYFRLYDSLDEAIYVSPFFGLKDFNVWEADGFGECVEERTSKKFSKAKTISLKSFTQPTDENRIIVAILCSLNIVKENNFLEWCSSYLKNEDRSEEKAFIVKESFSELEKECEEFSCAVPLLSCLSLKEKTQELTAASIFRAISDSIDLKEPIELKKLFKIASVIKAEEIASIIN